VREREFRARRDSVTVDEQIDVERARAPALSTATAVELLAGLENRKQSLR
jgi:hypothetical protein